jgi:hypothetical protein
MAAYLFDGAPADAALTCLAAFANPDGGFGHALEPDLRTAASSVLCTTVGLQHLRTLHVPATHPLVAGAMAYLRATFDPAIRVWPIIPPAVEDAPHAPWWGYDDGLAERWGGFLGNPRPEIVGYLWQFGPDDALRAELLDETIAYLDGLDALDMHALQCYLRLLDTPDLPREARARLLEGLTPLVDAAVARKPAQWAGYALPPLTVAPTPDAPFRALMGDSLDAHLDYLLAQQGDDGGWAPTFSWGTHPEVWAVAEREWRGILTLGILRGLRAYGRV